MESGNTGVERYGTSVIGSCTVLIRNVGAMHVRVYNREHVCKHPNECPSDGNKGKAIKEVVLQSKKLNFQTVKECTPKIFIHVTVVFKVYEYVRGFSASVHNNKQADKQS